MSARNKLENDKEREKERMKRNLWKYLKTGEASAVLVKHLYATASRASK